MATQRLHTHPWICLAHRSLDFDKLDWNNEESVKNAINYIDKYVSAWNPKNIESRNQTIHRSPKEDPCLMDTTNILTNNPLND